MSDRKPLKNRTRSGGWSYVHDLPLLSIEKTIVKDQLYEEFEKSVSQSLKYDDESIKKRLPMHLKCLKKSKPYHMITEEDNVS